jgi:hypothetical protein
MQPDAPREADKPFPALLRELGDEIGTLVRQEIALAKVELTEKLKPAEAAGIAALGVQVWLSALIVTIVYGVVAFVLAQTGKKKMQDATPLVPEQTAQTVKEDIEWAKTRAKSGVR